MGEQAPFLLSGWLFYLACPAEGVFDIAPLDAGQRIIQLLCQFAGLEVIDRYFILFVTQLSDR